MCYEFIGKNLPVWVGLNALIFTSFMRSYFYSGRKIGFILRGFDYVRLIEWMYEVLKC
jgi:hypothetical protein